MVDHYLEVEHMNDLNSPLKCVNKSSLDMNNIGRIQEEANNDDDDDSHYKIVMKRIEFFESNRVNGKAAQKKEPEVKKEAEEMTVDVVDGLVADPPIESNDKLLSSILLSIFILTLAMLIIFPLPNY